jgi:hypothetical protein
VSAAPRARFISALRLRWGHKTRRRRALAHLPHSPRPQREAEALDTAQLGERQLLELLRFYVEEQQTLATADVGERAR